MEPRWRNRIISEFSMPVQDAFDGLSITNLGGCRLGLFCGGLDDLHVSLLSLAGVINVVLQLRLWDAASSEFGRAFSGFLLTGSFLLLLTSSRHRPGEVNQSQG